MPASPGRTAQDDQLQLFAALLIVNLLHVKGITSKDDRAALGGSLQRAFDDATEMQVRETIAVGLKRLAAMGSRRGRLSSAMGSLSLSRKSKADKPPPGVNPGQRAPSNMQGFGLLAVEGSPVFVGSSCLKPSLLMSCSKRA